MRSATSSRRTSRSMTFYMGGTRRPETTASLASTRAPRMVGKPLYVLIEQGAAPARPRNSSAISPDTNWARSSARRPPARASATSISRVPAGYVISISVGRAVLASTGKDWEAVGIAPTVETPAEKALDVAKVRALRTGCANAPSRAQGAAERHCRGSSMPRSIRSKTELPLSAYAGVYGERTVTRTTEN